MKNSINFTYFHHENLYQKHGLSALHQGRSANVYEELQLKALHIRLDEVLLAEPLADEDKFTVILY